MTKARKEEIENKAIYTYASSIVNDIKGCEDIRDIVFIIGLNIGLMSKTLSDELQKEVTEEDEPEEEIKEDAVDEDEEENAGDEEDQQRSR